MEPISGLGTAIGYLRKHWEPLTRFLHVPGAPLDNNVCERALNKAILHRKNALFFQAEGGPGGRPLHEPHPHLPTERRGFLPLPHDPPDARRRAGHRPPRTGCPWTYRDTPARSAAPPGPSPPPTAAFARGHPVIAAGSPPSKCSCFVSAPHRPHYRVGPPPRMGLGRRAESTRS